MERRLHDRCVPLGLSDGDVHMMCVDNFCAISESELSARAARDAVWELALKKGLYVHEELCGQDSEFLGLDVRRSAGKVPLTQKRYWRLHQALKRLLQVGRCSSKCSQKIIGVASWSMLLHRPLRSVFCAVYSFAEGGAAKVRNIWPCVKRELGILQALLPFCRKDLRLAK